MKDSVIQWFEKRGWNQSHTATDKGCVFEQIIHGELVILAVDQSGCTLGRVELDEFARPLASQIVQGFYKEINK